MPPAGRSVRATRCALPAAILTLLAFAGARAPLSSQGAGDPPAARSVLEGVYTAAQAREGRALFEETCSRCHSAEELSSPGFREGWMGRTVGDLFGMISANMPFDEPGSFRPEQYAAVLAYLLTLNGYPAGEEALPTDGTALSGIRIEPPPAGGAASHGVGAAERPAGAAGSRVRAPGH